ncbi:MAG: AMP-binding protein [Treponema sp.]|nr:AMP-binding protein [Treponema sp.]
MKNLWFEQFFFNATNFAEKISVIDEKNKSYTYKEHVELSGKVYAYLKDKGFGPEQFIAIRMPRCSEAIICQTGILRNGSAFVTLETDTLPEERIDFIIKDCECAFVITEKEWEEIVNYREQEGYNQIAIDNNLAYIVYTSGSTGIPKGALHERGDLLKCGQSIEYNGENLIKANDVFAHIIPLNMASALIVYQKALYTGVTIALFSMKTLKSPEVFIAKAKDCKVTGIFVPPSLIQVVAKIPNLRIIITGGESSSRCTVKNVPVYNNYGSSEATWGLHTPLIKREASPSTLGIPQPDHKVQILDENGDEIEGGKIGELCFYNPYFRGYINNPELTEESFRAGKIYRSRDAAKWTNDGELMIVGRLDDMIKINGNRVEPGEIEAAIKESSVWQNVVVKGFVSGEAVILCAFYESLLAITQEEIDRLKKSLTKKLPVYMIPQFFICVEKFSLLPSGKIDRKAISAPDFSKIRASYKAPENEIQQKICNAFSEVMQIPNVGIEDDIVLLGADSVAIMELLVYLKEFKLSYKDFINFRTPKLIAENIQQLRLEKAIEEKRSDFNHNIDYKVHQLLPAQRAIFMEQLFSPGSTFYNYSFEFELPCEIEIPRFEHTLDLVFTSHPGFFMTFIQDEDGNILQKYTPNLYKKITLEEEVSDEELKAPFELFGKHLYRARLYRKNEKIYFFLCINHVLFSGFSLKLLSRQFEEVYSGKLPETDPYMKLLNENDRKWESGDFVRNTEFYKNILNDSSYFSLPVYDNSSSIKRARAEYRFVCNDISEKFYSAVKEKKILAAIACDTAYAAAASVFNKNSKIRFSHVDDNLASESFLNSFGNFLDILIMQIDTGGKNLKQIYDELLQQYQQRRAKGNFDISIAEGIAEIVYQFNFNEKLSFFGSKYSVNNVFDMQPDFEDYFNVRIFDDYRNLSFILLYDSAKYKKESIENFASLYEKNFRELINLLCSK